jgi:hypothetical protein
VSGPAGAGELRGAIQRRTQELEGQLAEIKSLSERHGAERRKLEVARRRALDAAAAAILPSLAPEALARAVGLSGLTPLVQEDPRGAIERERRELEARIAEIEADPRHRDRELLRAPRVGTLSRQVAELEEFRGPLAESLTRAEHPRLARLLESGYGTAAYGVGWWRASYYADWKAGDEIVERFPDKKTFAEVRAELDRARESLAVYDAKLEHLRHEIALGEALEREHETRRGELASVEARHLTRWRERLTEHLAALDPGALADRLAAEPDVALLLKQAFGLEKKIAYLDEIVSKQVAPLQRELQAEHASLTREWHKLGRPKNAHATMPRDKFEKRFQHRPAKLRKGITRVTHAYETVHHFDRWDRGRFVDDFLWWDVMTDGRLDGDFIPEVREHHRTFPDRPDRTIELPDDSAAAAAAAAQDARGDDGTLVDAS